MANVTEDIQEDSVDSEKSSEIKLVLLYRFPKAQESVDV